MNIIYLAYSCPAYNDELHHIGAFSSEEKAIDAIIKDIHEMVEKEIIISDDDLKQKLQKKKVYKLDEFEWKVEKFIIR